MHPHQHTHAHAHSRRDFFSRAFGGALAGASILEEAFMRATWARAQSPGASTNLFTIEKIADGVYAALARPQILTNCNAAIFVNSQDVLVVDAHSKPSAAAALIAQIKKDITTKPVRYLVNSHFHWDHTQGNAAYKAGGAKVDIIASDTTKQLMIQLSRNRLKESLDGVPQQIDTVQARLAKAASNADKERYTDLLRQLKAYQIEMKSYTLELPTITFAKSYVIKDSAGDLHIDFHGRAHTAGDIAVFSPQKRAIAAGDIVIGLTPNLNDGYPRPWPATIDSVGQLAFDSIIPGHGPVQQGRARMAQMRSYIEELTERIEEGKKAGKPLAEMQKTLTPTSIRSLQANGYGSYVADNLNNFTVYIGQRTPLEDRVAGNIGAIYKNLDRA
jgi:glyoxylase-like metal-dependent hydrolase (beta-lactamase superfamily II)